MLRKVLKRIDRKLFRGHIAKILLKQRRRVARRTLKKQKFESVEIFYNKNYTNLLADLFDKYGSDKGSNTQPPHVFDWVPNAYADLYSFLFDSIRNQTKLIFECGIGTNNPKLTSSMGERGKPGASLRAWKEYFPNAEIYGADIDTTIQFKEKRITTGFIDQLDPTSIRKFFETHNLRGINIAIDDGLHTYEAATTLFENVYPLLSKNGIYVIEDIHPYEMKRFIDYFKKSKIAFNYAIFTNQDGLPVGNLMWAYK
jgi:hypothetical protein